MRNVLAGRYRQPLDAYLDVLIHVRPRTRDHGYEAMAESAALVDTGPFALAQEPSGDDSSVEMDQTRLFHRVDGRKENRELDRARRLHDSRPGTIHAVSG